MRWGKYVLILTVFFVMFPGRVLSAQDTEKTETIPAGERSGIDPLLLIGADLNGIIRQFGIPESVYAVRGLEPWQDDVVFVYPPLDIYFFKDRVWQVATVSGFGIRTGDPRERVSEVLGTPLRDEEGYLVFSLPGRAWPAALRVNFSGGSVSGLFVYRSDF
ncbi:hypothetical protein [Breznakiella homolactica]|uniref:Uncharacterized protein n=1 Tax=Breznakiella homolactica TaxID=2798577 RepID=A0A7T7XM70_9SPIR|nr:hypothetical protein [Breznakiella homolactica]QQO08934.1 hypothetical protein JFL75_18690 [Breznakiella homolactica]